MPTQCDTPSNDTLLCHPTSERLERPIRRSLKSESKSDELIVKDRSYNQQYAGLYFSRLVMMRSRILEHAKSIWEHADQNDAGVSAKFVSRVLDVNPGELCYIVGTIYADLQGKPNILDEVTAEHWAVLPPPRAKYVGEGDVFMLEDESGRIPLVGDKVKELILATGVVVGVLGSEMAKGEFQVLDVCYPPLPVQKPLKVDDDVYIALMSGLSIGSDADSSIETQLLVEYLTGELGTMSDQQFASKIARAVVAGNSLAPITAKDETNGRGKKMVNIDTAPLQNLDALLSSLCSSVPIDILPGSSDPTTLALPQQPLHPSLFPRASCFDSLKCVPNPYIGEVEDAVIMGTSGQTLDDLYKYTPSEDRLAMLEANLTWGHIAPTAPDTLWCYPFTNTDPFVMQSYPHIFFAGNQPEFGSKLVTGPNGEQTRIILIPKFTESKSIVLVNLRTLDATEVKFSYGC